MRRTIVIALAASILCAACGTVIKVADLNPSPRPLAARSIDAVKVYTVAPAEPFTEVKLIVARQEAFTNDDIDVVIAKMKGKAAELGCDGLIIRGSSNEHISGQYGGKTLQGYVGSCVVFTGVPATSSERSR